MTCLGAFLLIITGETNSEDLDEVAHYEPPHQNLCCLQTQLFSPLVLKEVILKLQPVYDMIIQSSQKHVLAFLVPAEGVRRCW